MRLSNWAGLVCRFLPLCGLFAVAGVAAHAEIRVTERAVVAITSLGHDQVRYTYRVQAQNLGAAATHVTAVAQSFSPTATIEQGKLTFPDMPAGGTATSTNTFTVIYNLGGQGSAPGGGMAGNAPGSAHGGVVAGPVGQNVLPDASLIRFVFSAISTPVADAGPDQLITALNSTPLSNWTEYGTDCCWLNARGSYDPFGLPLTYYWWVISAPAGSTDANLNGYGGVVAYLTPDLPGDYVMKLVVSNGYHNSAPSYVHLSTVAVAPKADAGYNQTIKPGETVQLDGTHSVNPMNRPLTYAWSFVSVPPGTHPTLSDSTSPRPTFVAAPPPRSIFGPTSTPPESYTLQLVVTDGALTSAPATVTYTTGNTPPRADAGPDLHLAHYSWGFLSANRSTDVNGDFLTYRWVFLSGSNTKLSPVPNPTEINGSGIYHIELFVSDGYSESISTQVVSNIDEAGVAPFGMVTMLPATAVVDPPGTTPGAVTLDGNLTRTSDDVDGAFWNLREAPAGSTAQLVPNGLTATITPDQNGLYIAQFQTKTWGSTNYPTAVSFLTQGGPPVANPGSTQFGLWTAPTVHTLDGSASWDPDGRSLTYHWSLLSKPLGSWAELSSATAVSPTFTADADGTYIFQLVVNNGLANSAPAVVSVISLDPPPPVAEDTLVSWEWKSQCVLLALKGNDPLLDPYQYAGEIDSGPGYGFLGVYHQDLFYGWGTEGTPANNPEGHIGAFPICYIPFVATWTGSDTFTYSVWDDGYPSGCRTPGNYCIGPKKSAPATASILIFQP